MLSYEIDWAYNIVDFTLEDDSGKHHDGMGFEETKTMCHELLDELEKETGLKNNIKTLATALIDLKKLGDFSPEQENLLDEIIDKNTVDEKAEMKADLKRKYKE